MEIKIVNCLPKVKVTKEDLIALYYVGSVHTSDDPEAIKIKELSEEKIKRIEAWLNKGIMEYEEHIDREIWGD